jgi:hypothetical protein
VDKYLEIGAFIDGGLQQQAALDLDSFQRAAGRSLTSEQAERFREAPLKALRWTFLGSGITHPSFLATVDKLGAGLREKLETVAPAFAETRPHEDHSGNAVMRRSPTQWVTRGLRSQTEERVDPRSIETDDERIADGEGGRGIHATRLEERRGVIVSEDVPHRERDTCGPQVVLQTFAGSSEGRGEEHDARRHAHTVPPALRSR